MRQGDMRQSWLAWVCRVECSDEDEAEKMREEAAITTAKVLEAMRRKGAQICQLREYCDLLT